MSRTFSKKSYTSFDSWRKDVQKASDFDELYTTLVGLETLNCDGIQPSAIAQPIADRLFKDDNIFGILHFVHQWVVITKDITESVWKHLLQNAVNSQGQTILELIALSDAERLAYSQLLELPLAKPHISFMHLLRTQQNMETTLTNAILKQQFAVRHPGNAAIPAMWPISELVLILSQDTEVTNIIKSLLDKEGNSYHKDGNRCVVFESTQLCNDEDLSLIFYDIYQKVSRDQWNRLVFHQIKNDLQSQLFNRCTTHSDEDIKQIDNSSYEGTQGLVLSLRRYNQKIADIRYDFVSGESTPIVMYTHDHEIAKESDDDSVSLEVQLHMAQQEEFWEQTTVEELVHYIKEKAEKPNRQTIQNMHANLYKVLTDDQVHQLSICKWLFVRLFLENRQTLQGDRQSYENTVQLLLSKYEELYIMLSSSPIQLMTNSIFTAELQLAQFHKEELLLMLVRDAAMLEMILRSIQDEDERYGLLMKHYKENDCYRNIDTPAILILLCRCYADQIEPMIQVVLRYITNREHRRNIMCAYSCVGHTIIDKLILRCKHDSIRRSIQFISENVSHADIAPGLMKKDIDDRTSLELLLFTHRQNMVHIFDIVEEIMKIVEFDELSYLQSAYRSNSRHLYNDCGKRIFEKLDISKKVIFLRTVNDNGNTPLHVATSLEELEDKVKGISTEVRLELFKTPNQDGDTCFHNQVILNDLLTLNQLVDLIGDQQEEGILELLRLQNKTGNTICHEKVLRMEWTGSFLELVDFLDRRPKYLDICQILTIKDLDGNTAIDVMINATKCYNLNPIACLPLVRLFNSLPRTAVAKVLTCEPHHRSTTAHLICNKAPELMASVIDTIPEQDVLSVVNVEDEFEETPLHILAQKELVLLLNVIAKMHDKNISVLEALKHQNIRGDTVFHIVASKYTEVGVVKKLCDKLPLVTRDCDINSCTNHDCALSALQIKNNIGAAAFHIAAALHNRAALADMTNAVNLENTLGILYEAKIDFDNSFYLKHRSRQSIQGVLKKFKSGRSAVETVLASANVEDVHPQLRQLTAIVDKAEFDELVKQITANKDLSIGSTLPKFKSKLGEIMRGRYADGDTIIHSLARRSDVKTLQRLLGEMNHGEKAHWLASKNFANKIPEDLGGSFGTRTLLSSAMLKQDQYFMPIPPEVLIFYSTIDRSKADDEAKNLEAAFHKVIGQENTVKLCKDPTKQELLRMINDAALADPSPSGLFVVVIAHGKDGNVMVGNDSKTVEVLKIQDILDRMCEVKEDHSKEVVKKLQEAQGMVGDENKIREALETMLRTVKTKKDRLEGKPKVLLIQACQSSFDRHNPDIDKQEPGFSITRRDTIALSATIRGYPAKRNTMIPIFAEVLRNPEHGGEIYEMFLQTNHRFTMMNKPQIPIVHSTLTQKLFLKSDLWKTE